MDVPEAPRHTTMLARFTALRRVVLKDPELKPCQVCLFVCCSGAWQVQVHGRCSMRLSPSCLTLLFYAYNAQCAIYRSHITNCESLSMVANHGLLTSVVS